jgi:hypothetical protein
MELRRTNAYIIQFFPFYFYCIVRTTSSQNKKYTCKNNFYKNKLILSSSIYFYCIVHTNSSLMELRELHALVTDVTVTSYSYSTGYSYSSIVSHGFDYVLNLKLYNLNFEIAFLILF